MALSGREVLLVIRARDEASRILRGLAGTMLATDKASTRTAAHMIGAGAALTSVGIGLTYIGAIGVAALGKAAKASIEYNKEAAKTKTQVDQVGVSIKRLENIGINVARTVPVAFDETQTALYDVFSSIDVGVKGSRRLLMQFAKDAVAGQTDLQTATRANITILNAYGLEVKDATKVSDFMFQLVRKGVGTYEEFAHTIGRAIPSTVRAGQSYRQLGGMLAFMTRNGMSAAMAASSAGRAFDAISNPKTVTNLKKMGVSVKDAKGEFIPMVDIIGKMNEKLKNMTGPERAKTLQELFAGSGGTIQARRFFDSAFKNFDEYKQRVDEMKATSGQAAKAYETMSKTPAAAIQLLQNRFQIMAIRFGQVLLPVIGAIALALSGMLDWFEQLSPATRKLIIYIIAASAVLSILLGIVLASGGAFLMMAGAAMLAGVSFAGFLAISGGVVVAIALLAAGAIYAAKNWEQFKKQADSVWHWLSDTFGPGLTTLWSEITDGATSFAESAQEAFQVLEDTGVIDAAVFAWGQFLQMMMDIKDGLRGMSAEFDAAGQHIGGFAGGAIATLGDTLVLLAKLLGPVLTSGLQALAAGLDLMSNKSGAAITILGLLAIALMVFVRPGGLFDAMLFRGALAAGSIYSMATKMALLRGAAGIAGIALMQLGSKISETHQTMGALATIAGATAIGFSVGGPWGAAIGAGAGLLSILGKANQDAAADMDALKATLDQQTGAVTENTRSWALNKIIHEEMLGDLNKLGISTGLMVDAMMGSKTAIDQVNTVLRRQQELHGANTTAEARSSKTMRDYSASVDAVGGLLGTTTKNLFVMQDAIRGLSSGLGAGVKHLDKYHTMTLAGEGSSRKMGQALLGEAMAGLSNAAALQKQSDAMAKWVTQQQKQAMLAIQKKHDEIALIQITQQATKTINENGRGLNEHTKKGQENWQMLQDVANQWNNTKSKIQEAHGAYKAQRDDFIDLAHEAGKTIPEAEKLADKWLDIPPNTKKAREAVREMAAGIKADLRSIPDEPVKLTMTAIASNTIRALQAIIPGHATGGPIVGPGGPRDDKVLIRASDQEHMVTAREVMKAGAGNYQRGHQVWQSIRRMVLRGEMGKMGDLTPFASGGPIVNIKTASKGVPSAINTLSNIASSVADSISAGVSAVVNKAIMSGPAGMSRGLSFARAQVGKPYVWGGVGPNGYDCSGFQSAITNVIRGSGSPYHRLGSTASMPWGGFGGGQGGYSIGWTPNFGGSGIGHTAGTLLGTNVESYGGHGPAVGNARSAFDSHFSGLMHLLQGTHDKGGVLRNNKVAVNKSGSNEAVLTAAQWSLLRQVANGLKGTAAQDLKGIGKFLSHAFIKGMTSGSASDIRQTAKDFGEKLKTYFGDLPKKLQTPALRAALGQLQREMKKETDVLAAYAKRREALNERISKARDRLQNILAAKKDLIRSVKDTFTAMAQITSFTSPSDYRRLRSSDILGGLRENLRKALQYTKMLKKLRKMGLDDRLYQQLLLAGPEEGYETARALVQGGADDIRKANKLAGRIVRAGGVLGQTAGNQLYSDNIKAARAWIQELIKRRERLNHLMEDLARHLAREMARALHAELNLPDRDGKGGKRRRRRDRRGRGGGGGGGGQRALHVHTHTDSPRKLARKLSDELDRRGD